MARRPGRGEARGYQCVGRFEPCVVSEFRRARVLRCDRSGARARYLAYERHARRNVLCRRHWGSGTEHLAQCPLPGRPGRCSSRDTFATAGAELAVLRNDSPVAASDSISVTAGAATVINVAANDSDGDGTVDSSSGAHRVCSLARYCHCWPERHHVHGERRLLRSGFVHVYRDGQSRCSIESRNGHRHGHGWCFFAGQWWWEEGWRWRYELVGSCWRWRCCWASWPDAPWGAPGLHSSRSAVGQRSTSSTRLLRARASSFEFDPAGATGPMPTASESAPLATAYLPVSTLTTAWARRCDKSTLCSC